MMTTLEEFKKGKIAINTRTQEEYYNSMRFFDERNINFGFGKASRINYFPSFKGTTCISYGYDGSSSLGYDCKAFYKKEDGYKIILPIELQEYNEFMGGVELAEDIKVGDLVFKGEDGKYHKAKPKYITTHAELMKLHRKKVTCKIDGEYVKDAEIRIIESSRIRVCSYLGKNLNNTDYNKVTGISNNDYKYEDHNNGVTEIKLKEGVFLEVGKTYILDLDENGNVVGTYLTIGQAIDYMLESEDNVIEYYDISSKAKFKSRIIDKNLEYTNGKYYKYNKWSTSGDRINHALSDWTKIKKHIEPVEPKKTIKDLIQAKETFEYKNNWYRFNKDGAVIDSVGGAVGLDKIKEILTNNKGK